MVIEARINSSSIAGKLRDGAYELPENSTVADFLETAQREAGYELTEEQKTSCVYVFNNSPATSATKLQNGGKLRIMFKILGG